MMNHAKADTTSENLNCKKRNGMTHTTAERMNNMMSHAKAATAKNGTINTIQPTKGDTMKTTVNHSKADLKSEESNNNDRNGMTHTSAETAPNMISKAATKHTLMNHSKADTETQK
jgi:hypothetical protein